MNMFLSMAQLFLVGVAAPQALGFLCLRRALRQKRDILLIPGLLLAPALFYLFARVFWNVHAETFPGAADFSTTYGTMLHLGLSCALFLMIRLRERRRRRLARTAPAADAAEP